VPPLEIRPEWVERIRAGMPELPDQRHQRFMSEYQLSEYDASLLTEDRPVADYFERTLSEARRRGMTPKPVANWITGEVFRLLHDNNLEITAIKVAPAQLAEVIGLVTEKVITMSTGKHVLRIMFETGRAARDIVAEEGLAQITGADQLAPIVEQVIATNTDAVAQYKRGKHTVLRFLLGQVMKATKGKADPKAATEMLKQKLTGS